MTVPTITINKTEIVPIVFNGVRVITLSMMDKVHERKEGTASRNFNSNKPRMIEGEDFYLVDFSQNNVFRTFGIEIPPRGLIVLTETGYLILVKSFTDDLAWQVQRQLVNSYFRMQTEEPKTKLHYDCIPHLLAISDAVARVPGVQHGIAMASALQAIHEATGIPTEPFRLALPAKAEPLAAVNPTQLGKPLGLSGQAVNKRLQSLGMQFKNERGEWGLTEAGMQYGEMHPYARNGHSGYQPLWRAEAEELLK